MGQQKKRSIDGRIYPLNPTFIYGVVWVIIRDPIHGMFLSGPKGQSSMVQNP